MQLSRYATGSAGEEAFGFCQAVRRGPHVAVSGSTGRDVDGHIVPGGAYAQARQAIENLQTALAAVGGSLADVIRTRVFIVDMTEWEAVARAHCEAFARAPAGQQPDRRQRLVRAGHPGRDRSRRDHRGRGVKTRSGPCPRPEGFIDCVLARACNRCGRWHGPPIQETVAANGLVGAAHGRDRD